MEILEVGVVKDDNQDAACCHCSSHCGSGSWSASYVGMNFIAQGSKNTWN